MGTRDAEGFADVVRAAIVVWCAPACRALYPSRGSWPPMDGKLHVRPTVASKGAAWTSAELDGDRSKATDASDVASSTATRARSSLRTAVSMPQDHAGYGQTVDA